MSGRAIVLSILVAWGVGPGMARGQEPGATAAGLPPPASPGAEEALPPLPPRSPRIASYAIEARLDPVRHTLEGSLVLDWRNAGEVAVSSFPFHLYWNAFRNNLSTSARGKGRRAARPGSDDDAARGWGFIQVRSARLLDPSGEEADLTPSLRFIHPDDDNADDRTVMEVSTPSAVPPGATARFQIEWTSRIPYGDVGRAGWIHDYNFIVQWFPKIGVLGEGGWNCHQFHAWTEFFSDYGNYDVRITLPRGFVVGATGRLEERSDNPDGTETLRFVQEDVHDFAWTASRRFLERTARFDDAGYPPVEIRLLLQPEHRHLADRYIEATEIALRSYGTWSAPYPYAQITVVDPAWMSASGGMEYPTLFTGGARVWSPPVLHSPEGVTIHEAGHQFWYGLVGNNEFEEAWLDEGFNTYHTAKAEWLALGPEGWGTRYFGLESPRGSRGGWPVVAPGVYLARGEDRLAGLREDGTSDVMAKPGWTYRDAGSYGLNSYGKPALTLQTLEALVGDETMTRIMRTYARRFRFAHPTTADFIATVAEVTGEDYRWFFDQTWFSSDLCDYAVSVSNEKAREPEGYEEGPDGTLTLAAPGRSGGAGDSRTGPFDAEVTVERRGGVRLPVDVLVEFAGGRQVRETWDGRDRWKRFRYDAGAKVVRAIVDPDRKLALDVDPSNNTWHEDTGQARRAATKWSARFLFWLQNLLELHAILG
jgi:hypothetical protein